MISDCTLATSSEAVVVMICPSPLFAIYAWILSTLTYNVNFLATVHNVMSLELDRKGCKFCLTISYLYHRPKYFEYWYYLSRAEHEVVIHANHFSCNMQVQTGLLHTWNCTKVYTSHSMYQIPCCVVRSDTMYNLPMFNTMLVLI